MTNGENAGRKPRVPLWKRILERHQRTRVRLRARAPLVFFRMGSARPATGGRPAATPHVSRYQYSLHLHLPPVVVPPSRVRTIVRHAGGVAVTGGVAIGTTLTRILERLAPSAASLVQRREAPTARSPHTFQAPRPSLSRGATQMLPPSSPAAAVLDRRRVMREGTAGSHTAVPLRAGSNGAARQLHRAAPSSVASPELGPRVVSRAIGQSGFAARIERRHLSMAAPTHERAGVYMGRSLDRVRRAHAALRNGTAPSTASGANTLLRRGTAPQAQSSMTVARPQHAPAITVVAAMPSQAFVVPAARNLARPPVASPAEPAHTQEKRSAPVPAERTQPAQPQFDVAKLSDEVYRHIQRKIRIDRERRGL
jgi:hypothetical protein